VIPSRVVRPGARAVALVLLASIAVAACGGDGTASGAPSAAPDSPPPTADPAGASPSVDPGSTEPPAATADPEATATPVASSPPDPTPRPSGTTGPAAACTGSAENRAFYASVAGDVAWDVYCPVLPAGWFVDAGEFKLAGGGRLEIDYRGPAGARLEIRQGAYCRGDDDCIPAGPDVGTASFGDRPARLLDGGDGRWLVVAEGGDVNWEVRSSGLAREVAVALAADFARVDR
jgi:hypothetical protein